MDDFGGSEIVLGTEAVAGGAGPVGRIEAERTRLQHRNGNAAIGAGKFLRKGVFLAGDDGDSDETACELQRGGDGLFEARGDTRFDEQAVDDDFDGVILALINDRKLVEREEFAVDSNANVAVLREFFEFFPVGALPAADDGREDHDAVVGFAEFAVQDGLDNLLAGLARDW